MCERFAQGRYSAVRWPGIEPATSLLRVQRRTRNAAGNDVRGIGVPETLPIAPTPSG